jgi:hypothetical protein
VRSFPLKWSVIRQRGSHKPPSRRSDELFHHNNFGLKDASRKYAMSTHTAAFSHAVPDIQSIYKTLSVLKMPGSNHHRQSTSSSLGSGPSATRSLDTVKIILDRLFGGYSCTMETA